MRRKASSNLCPREERRRGKNGLTLWGKRKGERSFFRVATLERGETRQGHLFLSSRRGRLDWGLSNSLFGKRKTSNTPIEKKRGETREGFNLWVGKKGGPQRRNREGEQQRPRDQRLHYFSSERNVARPQVFLSGQPEKGRRLTSDNVSSLEGEKIKGPRTVDFGEDGWEGKLESACLIPSRYRPAKEGSRETPAILLRSQGKASWERTSYSADGKKKRTGRGVNLIISISREVISSSADGLRGGLFLPGKKKEIEANGREEGGGRGATPSGLRTR